jgi:hypothetical protein
MLSYNAYHPSEKLLFKDQSAMDYVLHNLPSLSQNWTTVPQRWFNAFPVNSDFSDDGRWKYGSPMLPEDFDDGTDVSPAIGTTSSFIDVRGLDTVERHRRQPWKIMKGDMAVHFAGIEKRDSWIVPWADRAEMYLPEWSSSRFQKRVEGEARDFWKWWREDRVGAETKRRVKEEEMKEDARRSAEELRRASSNSQKMRLAQEALARKKDKQLQRDRLAREQEKQKERLEQEHRAQKEQEGIKEEGREKPMGEKVPETDDEKSIRDEQQHANDQKPAKPRPSKMPKPHQHHNTKPHSNNRQHSKVKPSATKKPSKAKPTLSNKQPSNNQQHPQSRQKPKAPSQSNNQPPAASKEKTISEERLRQHRTGSKHAHAQLQAKLQQEGH